MLRSTSTPGMVAILILSLLLLFVGSGARAQVVISVTALRVWMFLSSYFVCLPMNSFT